MNTDIEYEINLEKNYTRVELSGPVTAHDIVRLRTDLLSDEKYNDHQDGLCIIDIMAMRSLTKELYNLRNMVINIDKGTGNVKWAVVIPSIYMVSAFVKTIMDFGLINAQIKLFQDEPAAVEWLIAKDK